MSKHQCTWTHVDQTEDGCSVLVDGRVGLVDWEEDITLHSAIPPPGLARAAGNDLLSASAPASNRRQFERDRADRGRDIPVPVPPNQSSAEDPAELPTANR